MQIFVTFGQILQKYNWEIFCKIKNVNPYIINEGKANVNDKVELSREEFIKIGGRSYIIGE